jgi:thymidine kinase
MFYFKCLCKCFTEYLFPGSKRLLEVADCIEEIETTCHYCANKAILNLKHVNGVADTSGPAVQLGAEEKYYPTCFHCYRREVALASQSPVKQWSEEYLHDLSPRETKCQD